ncbi:MAG TPA: VapC toxin family PIN domain ribonuclease [Balneolaceae bacterium]|nr:VapC toxin family PIN domain ribonuclease [Balneolaceae bacterium]|tara:strand:+ start:142 stop:534 length:393 start_codon:yes stop_codon:yes gene_type:complete
MKLVIDTSAILAVLLNESNKRKIIHKTEGFDLISPASLDAEIGNALSAMFKRGRISLDQAFQVIEQYSEVPVRRTPLRIVESLKISDEYSLYAYDAYMLDCARQYRSPIMSLDNGLLNVAKELNIEIIEV